MTQQGERELETTAEARRRWSNPRNARSDIQQTRINALCRDHDTLQQRLLEAEAQGSGVPAEDCRDCRYTAGDRATIITWLQSDMEFVPCLRHSGERLLEAERLLLELGDERPEVGWHLPGCIAIGPCESKCRRARAFLSEKEDTNE